MKGEEEGCRGGGLDVAVALVGVRGQPGLEEDAVGPVLAVEERVVAVDGDEVVDAVAALFVVVVALRDGHAVGVGRTREARAVGGLERRLAGEVGHHEVEGYVLAVAFLEMPK